MPAIDKVIERFDADVFALSGPIDDRQRDNLFAHVKEYRKRKNVLLVLCTYGGSASAAFRMARHLKKVYEKFTLVVFGECKSAGTLIALGADEIFMGCRGEFGPLDVQLSKEDDIVSQSSGLDISTALGFITDQAFTIFERHFVEVKERSFGVISTKTAADIATHIAVGLLSPITQQIDPLKLGEIQRAMKIAEQYGRRMGVPDAVLRKLVHSYASHDFVIDVDEARNLFPCVSELDDLLTEFEEELDQTVVKEVGDSVFHFPHPKGVLFNLLSHEDHKSGESEKDGAKEPSAAADAKPEAGADDGASEPVASVEAGESHS